MVRYGKPLIHRANGEEVQFVRRRRSSIAESPRFSSQTAPQKISIDFDAEIVFTSRDDPVAYLQLVTRGLVGWFQVVAIDPAKIAPLTAQSFRKPDIARPFIDRYIGRRNLYYCPNPLRSKLATKASTADVASIAYLYADLDCKGYGSGKALRAEVAALREKIGSHQPPPSVVIHTGNGIQALWRLRYPVPVCAGKRALNQLLKRRLGGDSVISPEHLLRLPGTVNIPTEVKREKGRVRTLSKVLSINA